MAFGSAKAVEASSKATACFAKFADAFFEYHSNTFQYIHNHPWGSQP